MRARRPMPARPREGMRPGEGRRPRRLAGGESGAGKAADAAGKAFGYLREREHRSHTATVVRVWTESGRVLQLKLRD